MIKLKDAIERLQAFVNTGCGNASDIADAVEVVLITLTRTKAIVDTSECIHTKDPNWTCSLQTGLRFILEDK